MTVVGNAGNAGNAGNTGNADIGLAAVLVPAVVRPVGLSPSMTDPIRGNGWPPSDILPGQPAHWKFAPEPAVGDYLGRGWELPYSRLVLFAQIATDADWFITAARAELDGIITHGDDADAELKHLFKLVDFRPNILDEALAQRNNLLGYFAGILAFNPVTHPYTYLLAAAAETYGLFLAMYWKAEYQRPRPSRRSPMLVPPVDPPGHAAFPSGHSTQAYLIARILAEILPDAAKNSYDEVNTPLGLDNSPLFRMAERLARNREVLGLHYPSDSEAGKKLAELAGPKLVAILNNKIAVRPAAHTPPNAVDLIARAQTEWT